MNEEEMGTALRFKYTNVPRQPNEQARLKIVQGPDYGAVYVVTGVRATVGRGEDSDIVISDLKASRKHAEFELGAGSWMIKDLKSANGILCNGKKVTSVSLKTGDTIALGETILEFVSSEVGTMMLVAPPKSVSQVHSEQYALETQKEKIRKSVSFFGAAVATPAVAMPAQSLGSPEKRKKILMAIVGLLAVWVLFGDDDAKKNSGKVAPSQQAKTGEVRDLASYLPGSESPEVKNMSKVFFHSGFREYQQGNYLRAKRSFETVLQMDPGHHLAEIYLENCKNAIESEVKYHLTGGKQSFDAGKFRSSRGHYEAIIRLLFYDQSNPAYTEAVEQLKLVNEKVGKGS